MADIKKQCKDCPEEFTYTERDQEFYKEKGYTEPTRCKPCRLAKKTRYGDPLRK